MTSAPPNTASLNPTGRTGRKFAALKLADKKSEGMKPARMKSADKKSADNKLVDWSFAGTVRLQRRTLPSARQAGRLPAISSAAMALTLTLSAMILSGCHSAFVQATIDNQGDTELKLLEVDYPSASFGVESLAPHAQYHYRFKIQGSGPVKLQFADSAGKLTTATGPEVNEHQEGSLQITITPTRQVTWQPTLHPGP